MAGNHKTQVRKRAAAVGFAGQIQACPAAVGRKILLPASSGGGAPRGPARVAVGLLEVPRLVRSSTARRWLLGPNGVPDLESFLLGFWELKCYFVARVSIWHPNYVYI